MTVVSYQPGGQVGMEELLAKVEANGGILTVTMLELRDAHGAGRLGEHVRSNISNALKSRGFRHYSPDLPGSQYESVRIYKAGSPVDELIAAVLTPGQKGDEKIRSAINNTDQEVLRKIRELVCD
jgi:hypothetical protein